MVIRNIRPTPEQMKEWGEKEGADWSFETEADRKKIADRFIRFLSFAKIPYLKDKKLQDVLEKEDSLKELILSLSSQEFLEMITGVNHLVRNIDDRKVWSVDGANVKMGEADMFPDQESKIMLMEEAFLIAQKMIREGRSLFDMSLMISRTITACHLFADGNGRAAKTLFFLTFSPGYKPDLIAEGITNSDKYYSFMVNGNNFGGHIAKLIKEEFNLDSGSPIDAPNDVRVAFVRKGIDIIANDNKPENTLTLANGEQENALIALKKYLVNSVEENLESIVEDYGVGSSKYKTYEILVNEFRKNL